MQQIANTDSVLKSQKSAKLSSEEATFCIINSAIDEKSAEISRKMRIF